MWKPDRSSKQPLYQQIAAYIERSIYNGEFSPGSILPSERKFAEQIHGWALKGCCRRDRGRLGGDFTHTLPTM
ncbi:GntR family transcriptional regulator [Paenibacillus alvei]|uniref:GntR family transcriptional regulator n=2 Tax=Paenibacillus alvei TaxID=44250 RepID=UPI000288582B|nr:transcriptional regulator [Paenibacillus alvei DSM 29]